MTGVTTDRLANDLGVGGSVRSVPPLDIPAIPRRELVTLAAYLRTGSHKGAAHRLGISESTCRQRISALLGRLGATNAAQAVWALRAELAAEIDRAW